LSLGHGNPWPEDFADVLAAGRAQTVGVELHSGRAWRLRITPIGVDVTDATAPVGAEATIDGAPMPVLCHLWARDSAPTADAPVQVRVQGDGEAIARFRQVLTIGTQ